MCTTQRLQVIFKTEIDGQLLCEIMDAIDRTWLCSSASECGDARTRPTSSSRSGITHYTTCAAPLSEASLPSALADSLPEPRSSPDTPPTLGADDSSQQLPLPANDLPLSELPLDSPQRKSGISDSSSGQWLYERDERVVRDGQSAASLGGPLLLSGAAQQSDGEQQQALECVNHLQELSSSRKPGSSACAITLDGRAQSCHDADRIAGMLESLTHGGRFVLARQLLGARGHATAESLFKKLQAADDAALLSGGVSVSGLRQLYGL